MNSRALGQGLKLGDSLAKTSPVKTYKHDGF